ncbi:MAG TPA: demethoxyubiquinone hydroxylase family protein, partial [Terricaulis sp.]|nr:demethoxyubiquinone hydroxylase family protein [Terricaulis sp.]
LMAVWSIGGTLLGAMTALFGRTGVYVCTAAVERTVHRHLIEQAAFLDQHDAELAALVRDILVEEDAHLAAADAGHDASKAAPRLLAALVSGATEMLIWLSTRGDSLRLKRAMAAA